MQKLTTFITLIIMLGLCGCSKKEVVPPPAPELRSVQTSTVWESVSINAITPVSAFEVEDACLKIFPYNNHEAYIKVEKILISGNGFWNTVTEDYKDTNNIRYVGNISYITIPNGKTMGYVPIDNEYAYLVSTDTLPSSYVEKVLVMLCNTST